MLVGFFKRNSTSSVLVVPGIALALWAIGFVHPTAAINKNTMPLFDWLCRATQSYPLLQVILALVIVIAEAFLVNHICDKYNILSKKTNLPALLYVVLMSCCKLFLGLHPLLLANLFILLSINRIFSSYHKEEAFAHVFDAGFYIGIASLFYFPAAILFPMVWVGLIVIRTFVWREWIISFIGLLLPYLFITTYYFWYEKLNFFLVDKIFYPSSDAKYSIETEPFSFIALAVFLVAFLLLSFFKLTRGLPVNTILSRNILVVFSWMLALSFLAFLMAPVLNLRYFSFMAIPYAIYASHYLLSAKRAWWSELVFSSFLLLIILNYIFYNS
ncbi:MAG: hypothetical protein IPO70_09810 [Bacteroidetes bacterium]|nr:hypothetical protein [Bacteroidota bacterium]MBK9672526.1 hypothetical protein [Bacteroidota bacterium]